MDCAIGYMPPIEPTVVEKLREMMNHVSEADRCTLCKAIEMLEKPNQGSDNWYIWIILIFMLVGGWGGDSNFAQSLIKAYTDSMQKQQEQPTDKT